MEVTEPAFLVSRLWTPGPWLTRGRRRAATAAGLLLGGLLLVPLLLRLLILLPPISRAIATAARRAVADRLGGAELNGPVRVGWLGVVELEDLKLPGPAAGDPPALSAQRITVRPVLASLLTGHPRAAEIELRWVRLHPGPRGSWLPAILARIASKRQRGPGPSRVGAAPAPPALTVRDLFIDLPLAGAGSLATLGPLAFRMSWTREGATLLADDPNPSIRWRVDGGLLDGQAGRFDLGGLFDPRSGAASLHARADAVRVTDLPPGWFSSVQPLAGTLSGTFDAQRGADGAVEGKGRIETHALSIDWARLDPAPVSPLDLALAGSFRWDPTLHILSVSQGRLGFNRGELELGGILALLDPPHFKAELRVDSLDLQSTIDSLPKALQPPAAAPRVEGPLRFDFELAGPLSDELEIRKAELDLGALRRSARADPEADFLLRPFSYTPEDPEGPRRTFEVGPRNPRFTPYASLPSYVPRAVVTSEDAGFFGHHGFDFDEIRASVIRDLSAGQAVRGGSTITQQLVKNLFLSRRKTLSRKLREALVTLEVEAALPKSRILELYLNTIEWGPDIYGIGEASERYFAVPATALTPREAAFLASVIPNPRRFYHLYHDRGAVTPRWNERVDRLLTRMHELGALDDAAYSQALAEPLVFHRGGAAAVRPPVATVGDRPSVEKEPPPKPARRSLWQRLFGH